MDERLADLDAVACAQLVRTRQCTARELVEAAIERIEAANPLLNAVVHERFEHALVEADAVSGSAPFAGVPFLYKDIGAMEEGEPWTAGMRLLRERDFVAPFGSHYADRVRAAGFIPLGRTNTPELGLCPTTEPEVYGPSRNPWDPARTPGGSSGGSAAAVAAGLVPVAHANDGGGSIRIPAAACGLVGLKPSRGRISWGPVLWEPDAGLAVEGVVSRTVRDTAALLDVLAGGFAGDPYAAPGAMRPWVEHVGADAARLRIGLLDEAPEGASLTHPSCVKAVQRAAEVLEQLGHSVETSAPAPLTSGAVAAGYDRWWAATTAAAVAALEAVLGIRIDREDVEPATWALIARGRATSAVEFLVLREELGALSRAAGDWWARGFDLLLTPTVQAPPPPLGELMSGEPETLHRRQLRWFPLTPFANVSGQPAMSLPVETENGEGLPVGVQLVAELGREDLLIAVGSQLEQALPWRPLAPPSP